VLYNPPFGKDTGPSESLHNDSQIVSGVAPSSLPIGMNTIAIGGGQGRFEMQRLLVSFDLAATHTSYTTRSQPFWLGVSATSFLTHK